MNSSSIIITPVNQVPGAPVQVTVKHHVHFLMGDILGIEGLPIGASTEMIVFGND